MFRVELEQADSVDVTFKIAVLVLILVRRTMIYSDIRQLVGQVFYVVGCVRKWPATHLSVVGGVCSFAP